MKKINSHEKVTLGIRSLSNMQLIFTILVSVVFFLKLLFILRERDRREWGRGRERERKRIPNRLHTVSAEPDEGHDPTNYEIKSQMLSQGSLGSSHPGTPFLVSV